MSVEKYKCPYCAGHTIAWEHEMNAIAKCSVHGTPRTEAIMEGGPLQRPTLSELADFTRALERECLALKSALESIKDGDMSGSEARHFAAYILSNENKVTDPYRERVTPTRRTLNERND